MATTATPIFPQTVTTTPITIVNADGTAKKTLYTAGTNGSKIDIIFCTNTDTNAYTINLYVTQSATDYLIGTVTVPLSAGNTSSAPTVNVLADTNLPALQRDANGNSFIYLSNGSTLKAAATGTVTSAKTVTFLTHGEDF